eukprot:CAMPEP_0171155940 /NCGR_PEP_ID=MMETSP0790-20130122/1173_1 /TAXON_ID=2925 /ORGANISM="Alexandrium catenella, Strain OF101" /LENGTH=414 /DNA_ID=CAMNT_0011620203 /DNA_START=60 /DNA_END=1302 /DNA_ORIENTATION=+
MEDPSAAGKRVAVRNLAGNLLGELEVDARTTGHKLKNLIAARWQLPPECQELLLGTSVLDDRGTLGQDSAFTCSEVLAVTLVMSLEKVYRRCEDASAKVRQRAVQALANAATKNDERAINAVSARLEDSSAIVKGAAVKAFPRVAERGNECAVGAATARLSSADADVRRAAVEALAQVAEKGDHGSIEKLMECLQDPNHHVRLATNEALAQLSGDSSFRQPTTAVQPPPAVATPPVPPPRAAGPIGAGSGGGGSAGQPAETERLPVPAVGHSGAPRREPSPAPTGAPAAPGRPATGGSELGNSVRGMSCPKGHPLQHFIVEDVEEDDDGFECDGCDACVPRGTMMMAAGAATTTSAAGALGPRALPDRACSVLCLRCDEQLQGRQPAGWLPNRLGSLLTCVRGAWMHASMRGSV